MVTSLKLITFPPIGEGHFIGGYKFEVDNFPYQPILLVINSGLLLGTFAWTAGGEGQSSK
jgi:hypothetical protein